MYYNSQLQSKRDYIQCCCVFGGMQLLACPGASTFIVDFDPRCETEKRYDYLEFTDQRGVKHRYDQKVGTDKWPLQVTFTGGHKLHVLFHSDSSNSEWGYKFKVGAVVHVRCLAANKSRGLRVSLLW